MLMYKVLRKGWGRRYSWRRGGRCDTSGWWRSGRRRRTVVVTCEPRRARRRASTEWRTISEAASHHPDLNTLAAALEAAELVETLEEPGPFTVFAPTDRAFDRLPEGTLDSLLESKNRKKLQSVLKYHVVPARLTARDVINQTTIETIEGKELAVKVKDGHVFVGGALVEETDVETGNGLVHVIDTVLLPPPK